MARIADARVPGGDVHGPLRPERAAPPREPAQPQGARDAPPRPADADRTDSRNRAASHSAARRADAAERAEQDLTPKSSPAIAISIGARLTAAPPPQYATPAPARDTPSVSAP